GTGPWPPDQRPPVPSGGVPLFARGLAFTLKPLVDQRSIPTQLRRRPAHRRTFRRPQRRRQRLAHRPPVNTMPLRQRPDRQPLTITITPDLLELLHSGSHSSVPPIGGRPVFCVGGFGGKCNSYSGCCEGVTVS